MIKRGTYSLFLFPIALAFCLFFAPSSEAKTLRIKSLGDDELTATIVQDPQEPLIAGQIICIINKGQEINCGKIFKANESEAVALFSEDGEKPLVGDELAARKRPPLLKAKKTESVPARVTASEERGAEFIESKNAPADPTPSPLLDATDETDGSEEPTTLDQSESVPGAKPKKPAPEMATTEEDADRIRLIKYHRKLIRKFYGNDSTFKKRAKKKASISFGLAAFGESIGNNFWPMGLFQFTTSNNSAVGIQGGYLMFGGSSVVAASYYLTLNYHYYPYESFLGPTGRVGIGVGGLVYHATTNNRISMGAGTPLVALATTGYRWSVEKSIDVGLEAGVQIFQFSIDSNFNNGGSNVRTTSNITSLMPLLLLDIGFSF